MKQPIRISVVSYLNSRPFLYGLKQSDLAAEIDLQEDIPSTCAEKLLSGKVDLGLVPVAILPQLGDYHIVGDYCIGSDGPVRSVLLVADVPLKQIRHVWLDHQSRTSVALVQALAGRYWNIHPEWHPAEAGYEGRISGDSAGVIIGDRAFRASTEHAYVYDLSEAWKAMTGQPFVFAVWASRAPLPAAFLERFNTALRQGVEQIPAIVETDPQIILKKSDLLDYYTRNIRYPYDTAARNGLQLFLTKFLPLVEPKQPIQRP